MANSAEQPHPALTRRHVLKGHTDSVYRMALSPAADRLASASNDGTVRIWDVKSGRLIRSMGEEPITGTITCAWSPDGSTIAAGYDNGYVRLWNAAYGNCLAELRAHSATVKAVAWSPDGKLASGANDRVVLIWESGELGIARRIEDAKRDVEDIAWAPDGTRLCYASWDGEVRLWDVAAHRAIRSLHHSRDAMSVAWSPDGRLIASGCDDHTVRIWDAETGDERFVLEGHTSPLASVAFLDEGRLLASLGTNGNLIAWRSDSWAQVLTVANICKSSTLCNLAVHTAGSMIIARDLVPTLINVWDLDVRALHRTVDTPTVFYVNAKAVLLGESGVGKSALGIRIAEGRFRATEGSTHGAQFWHFPTEQLGEVPTNVKAELTLWDLAGQPEYRLTHQLFLDDADAALLLFDCSDANDPFRGVPYWAKVLKKQAPPHALKLLVSGRSDVSPPTVSRQEINTILAKYGLDDYFRTSAHSGEGVDDLFRRVLRDLPWAKLPRTGTPRLFQLVREYVLQQKTKDRSLIPIDEILQAAQHRLADSSIPPTDVDAVVQLLQSRGLVYRLDARPDVAWVLLQPERVNQYGSSIIHAARNNPLGIGAVAERDILVGNLAFAGRDRLPHAEESLVLEGTAELLISHDLCFREMGYLVFPSQINVTRQPPSEAHPRTEVAYRFSGSIETIYASLVVRLSYTDYFVREDQWKYAVEFSREGRRLGFAMHQVEEGTGELEIYFYPGISEFDRVTFIRFVTDHLRTKGIEIEEHIRLYCPKCTKEVTNRDAIEARVRDGFLEIPCQYCAATILIPKSVEERYRRDPSLSEKQQQLLEVVEKRTLAEVSQFRDDQSQYAEESDDQIRILHLSDVHLEGDELADVYRSQLETDLIQELEIRRLDYLVLSGDIANRSTEEEYRAAFGMVDGLVKRFGLDASRVVVVPGNHDVNWDDSEAAYPFVTKRKLPTPLPDDKVIPAGEAGALLRDEELYRKRFARFSAHFYKRIYGGTEYPLSYPEQTLWVERADDRILFLGLNSCWELDHHFRKRASIHPRAVAQALDRLQTRAYDGWLKIAVWHHPVTGQEAMNDEFIQLLAVHGFAVSMHGHIHEAIEGFHKYDDERGLQMVGAGTFGAPAREQVTGIPLQYNLLTFDPHQGAITVQTRKKEKPRGTWSADARWGSKKDPKSWYRFNVRQYRTAGRP